MTFLEYVVIFNYHMKIKQGIPDKSIPVTYKGKKYISISAAAKANGESHSTLYNRFMRYPNDDLYREKTRKHRTYQGHKVKYWCDKINEVRAKRNMALIDYKAVQSFFRVRADKGLSDQAILKDAFLTYQVY